MATLAFHSAYAGGTNEPAIALAERLSAIAYPSINTFFFTSGGAESTETSFKTARFYWKALGKPDKVKVISRHRAYHGLTLAAMSATGLTAFWPMFEPRGAGLHPHRRARSVSLRQSPIPSVSLGVAAANKLEEAILREGPDTVAAFIAEPVQGAGGVIVPPADYFPRIREICDQYDVLLIADEVITGFGRTGRWFGLEHYGVEPDIMQFAKGITSGYVPLGGIGVSDKLREVINGVPPAQALDARLHLFGPPHLLRRGAGEPRHLRAAKAWWRARPRSGERLLSRLRTLESEDGVGHVRGLGTDGGGRGRGRQGDQAAAPARARRDPEADRRDARARTLHPRGHGLHLHRAAAGDHRRRSSTAGRHRARVDCRRCRRRRSSTSDEMEFRRLSSQNRTRRLAAASRAYRDCVADAQTHGQTPADTVLINGTILTVERANDTVAQAVAIAGRKNRGGRVDRRHQGTHRRAGVRRSSICAAVQPRRA